MRLCVSNFLFETRSRLIYETRSRLIGPWLERFPHVFTNFNIDHGEHVTSPILNFYKPTEMPWRSQERQLIYCEPDGTEFIVSYSWCKFLWLMASVILRRAATASKISFALWMQLSILFGLSIAAFRQGDTMISENTLICLAAVLSTSLESSQSRYRQSLGLETKPHQR